MHSLMVGGVPYESEYVIQRQFKSSMPEANNAVWWMDIDLPSEKKPLELKRAMEIIQIMRAETLEGSYRIVEAFVFEF